MVTLSEQTAEPWQTQLKQHSWSIIQGLLLAGAFGYLYASVIPGLVADWDRDPDYSHGFLIPLLSGYFLWERRQALAQHQARPNLLGLALVLFGFAMLFLGNIGAELFLMRTSMVVVIAGLAFYHHGWARLKVMAFPIGLLLFMIPWPAIILNTLTLPLQLFAARLSTASLQMINLPVYREGNVIFLPHVTLEVVEACSGIRSLVSLLALAVVFATLTQRQFWKRTVLVASAIPIAIIANAFRIWGTGVLAHWYGSQAADGFYHTFAGWLVFVVAFILLALTGYLLSYIGKEPTHTEAVVV
ncbi:MAG: exosortase A [Candidatus Tectimicrobiota bacterium]